MACVPRLEYDKNSHIVLGGAHEAVRAVSYGLKVRIPVCTIAEKKRRKKTARGKKRKTKNKRGTTIGRRTGNAESPKITIDIKGMSGAVFYFLHDGAQADID